MAPGRLSGRPPRIDLVVWAAARSAAGSDSVSVREGPGRHLRWLSRRSCPRLDVLRAGGPTDLSRFASHVVLGLLSRGLSPVAQVAVGVDLPTSQRRARCNLGMVELESLVDESDIWLLYTLIEDHVRHTSSPLGQRLLDNWELMVPRFVKVMPTEYKRVLQARRAARRLRPDRPTLPQPAG